ncbi:hypothetical protein P7D85_10230 [Enterococcus hulanensis]|uniref:Uncharacterized protein n=1 Tax=Enterococcus hulanensis TaxID=2559929 RepID=A0ABU3F1W1_9ENTE|nr:hypothetical protein [Enterococcus hulanensis]MDT2600151.1 hypothetical protein [Enterococcus hulanensis]MDT2608964.1 hypothetical protein [Enterococcus hulanensis]MDT2616994.1 hypothetical protein [Enterococcus hulanensis]MDT2628486.1 hypothetical protein [Enterococcus hulanensis]MDT2655826.1 hypothetical protein [Enterococcus hulanensis]
MLHTLTNRISTKQLNGFLIIFWSFTLVASALWLFFQINQQGFRFLAQQSVFVLYIFLLFFMTLLKLMTLAKFQSSKVGVKILFVVEILSLNFTTVIPLFLLKNRVSGKDKELSMQSKMTVGLLGVALILQTLIYVQMIRMS